MLNDENGITLLNQRVERAQQFSDVVKVQAGTGLIKNEQNFILLKRSAFGEERSQFHALGLATRERIGRLPKADIAQAHIL